MSWPSPADYQEALQHPRLCFSDPELAAGRPLTDKWGLPRAVSGAFASVYRVDTGNQKHAVRCFLRYVPDIERRYAIISEHLARSPLPYTVEFKYLKQGVRVRGDWYPVLKMDWVEGERLDTFVARNLNNSPALIDLADKFLKLTLDLRRASIAHGDLQHGNILVVNGTLRLIDYDGMYVPGLAGCKSNELGQPNYQHPKRTENDFGLYLDHFSEWVIYLTLLTLAVDPTTRSRFAFGNEYILFNREDYLHPRASAVLRQLGNDRDQTVRGMTMRLLSFLSSADLTRIPSLDLKLAARPMPTPTTLMPDWLTDHMPSKPAASARVPIPAPVPVAVPVRPAPPLPPRNPLPTPIPSTPGAGVNWMQQQIQSNLSQAIAAQGFTTSPTTERLILALTVAAMLLVALATNAALIDVVLASELLGATAVASAAAIGVRYKTLPEIRRKDELIANRSKAAREIERSTREVERLDQKLSRIREEQRVKTERVSGRQRDLTEAEVKELERVQNQLQTKVGDVQRRRQSLTQAEQEEQKRLLADLQAKALYEYLRTVQLTPTGIPGVGETAVRRLRERGIETAADMTDVQWVSSSTGTVASVSVPGRGLIAVHGIRPEEASALRAWRRAQEQLFATRLPQFVPLKQQAWVKTKYEFQRRLLDYDENRARQNARQSMESVHIQWQHKKDSVSRQLQDIPAAYGPREQELAKALADRNRLLIDAQTQKARIDANLSGSATLNFGAYLKHIF